MGLKDFLHRRANEFREAKLDFEIGCEILGPPNDPTSVMQRRDRMVAGHRERERRAALGSAVLNLDELARRAFRQAQQQRGRRDIQFEEAGVKVLVKNGYSRRTDSYTTDVILLDPGRPNEHLHIVFDEDGNELHKAWTANH